jgi:iron complex outermembrane recepter protein
MRGSNYILFKRIALYATKMKNTRTTLGVGLLAATFVVPAYAQQSANMEEVVVTARKRSETLQEVPLAVSVVSGAEIETLGLQDVTDLYGRVPGLYFGKGSITNPTTSNNYLIIRGIGWNAGLEPSVGVFVDGMYLPQIGYDLSFLDVERLEVLRGPQGTLFGRNTQGGALNIVTRRPDETVRGNVRAELAEFGTWRASGSFAGPTADEVFAGISLDYAKTDGFIRNVVTGEDAVHSERVSGRAVVRWTPTDALELMVIADASIKSFNEMVRGVPIGAERYDTFADQEADDETNNSGAQLNIDYELSDSISLTSITGYRKAEADIWVDTDSRITDQTINIVPATPPFTTGPVANQGAATPYDQDADYKSQELRLSGTSTALDWQVGGYYFEQNESQFLQRFLTAGVAFPFGVYLNQTYFTNRDGWAAFGQASYRPIEKLEFTVGGRYSDEDIHFGGQRFQFTTGPTTFFPNSKSSADNLSFMGSISYQFAPKLNAYLTYAEGWKAGGFNRLPSNASNNLAYDDETSTNYELGIKSTLADGRLLLNASVFWIDIEDQQVFNFITPLVAGGLPTSAIENAVASHVQGVELELVAAAGKGFTFAGNVAYNDTEYDDYVRRFSATDQFVMDGLDFENTPELTASVSTTFETPISERNRLEFFLNWRYVGDVVIQDNFIGATSRNQAFIPSYDRLDGRISLITDGGWRLALFCDNILDSFDYTDDTADPYRFALFPRFVKPLEPRQLGITVTKTF